MALNISRTCLQYLIFLFFVLCIRIPHCNASDNGCLEEGSRIIDGINGTLKSPGEEFELGFFTPDHDNSKSRYLGIWYNQSNPKIVVWVANRNEPLLESNGSLVIYDSFAKVLGTKGTTYWSSNSVRADGEQWQPHRTAPLRTAPESGYMNNGTNQYNFRPVSAPRNNNSTVKIVTRLCLEDNGNLVLRRREKGDQILWRSFDDPTDTFLPGMSAAHGSLNLTAWKAPSSPARGSYVFTLQPLDSQNKLFIKRDGSPHYWESRVTPFDQTPPALLSLLLNDASQLNEYNHTRLVMKFTGQIQFWKREGLRGRDWSLIWLEPKDECNLFEVCGNLGSCNSNNGLLCKCLQGSTASVPESWNLGDFSGGCLLRSQPCRRNYGEDVFLRMPMMRVRAPKTNETDEAADCETTCRKDCNCLAYSCGSTDCTRTDMAKEQTCSMWSSNELTDLQEEYPGGLTIFVRTENSTTDFASRHCKPCGTFIIPYPLSTAMNCGDPSYFNFSCNATSGQVYFSASNLTYKVTSLDPDAKKFTIQVGHGNSCDSIYNHSFSLSPEDSLHYNIGKCKVINDQSSFEPEKSFIEVEMSWKPPLGPVCNASSDCHSWPHTTCKTTRHGRMRCKCDSTFHWDGVSLKCTKVISPLKVGVLCVAGTLAIILLCGTFFMYRTRNRRMDVTGSVEFMEDDAEGIDVPFFDWEIILAATNNFADINKLGTGGFGSVYRGKLPDGQEIAVKRLSSVSVQGLEEFRTEVKLIAKLQHRNLVRLIGYCMKADEKILVYEYMPNGSLDSCLFDEKHSVYLDWEKRFDIILGIARGLLYLHQDSRLRIIHRDLKPSNILLDEELCPKISDFGLARIVGGKETHASTNRVVGTYGYMSPEYASDGIFSIKSDVFSFGVVILETIIGRRNSKMFMFEHGLSLLGHAWKLWNEDKGLELMDPKLNETCFPSEVLKCIHIGLLCVQEDPSDRPTMSAVVHMLSGENASLPLAKQPAFMNRKPLSENASSSSAMDVSLHEMMTVSTVGR